MDKDNNYLPCSSKASDFKITLSHGAKDNDERVSFLEQQVQQAKDAYEASLKTVIEECISLEIQAVKKEEMEIIMDLLPAIGSANQPLQGTDCNKPLQSVNVLTISPTLQKFSPITPMDAFLGFYQGYNNLNAILTHSIVAFEAKYPTVEECMTSLQSHMALLQKHENKGIQIYIKCLESILTIPTTAYNKQAQENQCLINLKKLSSKIMLGKLTEETTMDLDGEGTTNFEQLQELIQKECDKCNQQYSTLEEKYNKLEHEVLNNAQKTHIRGAMHQQASAKAPQRKSNPIPRHHQPHEEVTQGQDPLASNVETNVTTKRLALQTQEK